MSTLHERAQTLAREIKDTMKAIKAAEAKIKVLSQELTQVLAQARAEAEAALTVIEYPSGRYECASCGQSTMLTEPVRELPTCDNCGHRNFLGHEPTITKIEPPPPKKFPAGMYECAKCGARTGVVTDTDEMSPCELCGYTDFQSVQL